MRRTTPTPPLVKWRVATAKTKNKRSSTSAVSKRLDSTRKPLDLSSKKFSSKSKRRPYSSKVCRSVGSSLTRYQDLGSVRLTEPTPSGRGAVPPRAGRRRDKSGLPLWVGASCQRERLGDRAIDSPSRRRASTLPRRASRRVSASCCELAAVNFGINHHTRTDTSNPPSESPHPPTRRARGNTAPTFLRNRR